jgi:hypothetical protein
LGEAEPAGDKFLGKWLDAMERMMAVRPNNLADMPRMKRLGNDGAGPEVNR